MWLLVGCTDYSLFGEEEEKDPGPDAETRFGADTGGGEADVCPELPELPASSAIDEACDTEPQTGELSTRVEWARTDFGTAFEYAQVLTTPLVGQLTDDDGDGDLDRDDTPDVVVVADDNGEDNSDRWGLLAILSGADGSVHRTLFAVEDGEDLLYPYRYATPALAELDQDGVPEIVTIVRVVGPAEEPPPDTGPPDSDPPDDPPDDTGPEIPDDVPVGPPPPDGADPNNACALAAFHPDGSLAWRSADGVVCTGDMIAVADLDGDGYGEILAGTAVFDHGGAVEWQASSEARYAAYTEVGMQPVALDLDVDGQQEVLYGRIVYAADGSERCRIPDADPDGFPAAADLDDDGRGEFVLVGDGQLHVYEDDCSPAASWVLEGSGNGGPATIADFDGDGAAEIGVADADYYAVYEADGSLIWSQPISDASSHATGSSVFDFDGDGRAEVLYGDELALWVFDGATGAVRLQDDDHTSRTLHELPVAADVDGDGEMEIVQPQGGGHHGVENTGLYVLGSAGDPWLGDRQVWNQHAYSITNIEDDLSLPVPAEPNWPLYNTFRSGALSASAGGALADALPEAQICADPCSGDDFGLEVKVGNGGMAGLREGVPVTVYSSDGDVLARLRTATAVPAGGASETLHAQISAAAIPDGMLLIRVDDDEGREQVLECHEDNNELLLSGISCG